MASDKIDSEEAIIGAFWAPLAAGFPGAFDLKDDCAAIAPEPGSDLVVTTDAVIAGVHFLPEEDAGADRLEGARRQRLRSRRQGRDAACLRDDAGAAGARRSAHGLPHSRTACGARKRRSGASSSAATPTARRVR